MASEQKLKQIKPNLGSLNEHEKQRWPELNIPSKAKIFIIDTNVLLHVGNALKKLSPGNVLVVPMAVLEEVDDNKKGHAEKAYNARKTSGQMDEWTESGDIRKGIKTEDNGLFFIDSNGYNPLENLLGMNPEKTDTKIILTALTWQKIYPELSVWVISKDTNVRLKARACGLLADDYKADKVANNGIIFQSGISIIEPDVRLVRSLISQKELPIIDFGISNKPGCIPNECFILSSKQKGKEAKSALARYIAGNLSLIDNSKLQFLGIKPRNAEQSFAMELLLDPTVKVVALSGVAGTGKTLLALAAALNLAEQDNRYDGVLLGRPVMPMGKDIGYMPGDKDEKLMHWTQPFIDNLNYLLSLKGDNREKRKTKQNYFLVDLIEAVREVKVKRATDLIKLGAVELEPLSYIRGRSLQGLFVIVDEAQNLTPHEIKTIITRVGERAKIVFTGDPHQIDHPYLDRKSNGLTYLTDRFKKYSRESRSHIFGHVDLIKSERSEVSSIAAEIL